MTPRNVTGRDRYLVGQALAAAIALEDSLPEERRETSNRNDMLSILRSLGTDEMVELRFAEVHLRTGLLPIRNW